MKKPFSAVAVLLFAVAVTRAQAPGPSPQPGQVVVPDSTRERPEQIGHGAHTNHLIFKPSKGKPGGSPQGETPQSLRPVYNLSVTGGNGIIAIVDPYHYATAQNDFDTFSRQFGLPASTDTVCNGSQPCFRMVYATGSKPHKNCGWNQEAALDIEWAHAMAPRAQIVLVEAASNRLTDLFQAVDVATRIIQSDSNMGAGEVSMSWSSSEFSTEAQFDSHFMNTRVRVVYVGASGDRGGVNGYPSVSPDVVSAGGTTVNRDSAGTFLSETAWSGSGGGPSSYESRPSYQNAIVAIVGSQRGAPDFSFDSDPASGVSVYDSTRCSGGSGWLVFGGTSVAAPSLAGIVNLSSHFYGNSGIELSTIYSNLGNSSDFRDITSGDAGSFSAGPGWDFVTGVGSNQGTSGK